MYSFSTWCERQPLENVNFSCQPCQNLLVMNLSSENSKISKGIFFNLKLFISILRQVLICTSAYCIYIFILQDNGSLWIDVKSVAVSAD